METGYQIYKYDPQYDECFVSAGLHNWFPTFDGANVRKASLEATWGKRGVQYIIVNLAGRKL